MVKRRSPKSRSRSRSPSATPSRSRSRSRSRSPKKVAARKPTASKGKYSVVADNISMIPKKKQIVWCGSCRSKMPIDASKAVLIKLTGRPNFGILGPCSECGRQRSSFVIRPEGY